jgi:hypothetical protein
MALNDEALETCLGHLTEVEHLLEQAADAASLARLSLVIDMLLRENGRPDRDLCPSLLA